MQHLRRISLSLAILFLPANIATTALAKPFTREQLLVRVAECLARDG